MKISELALPVQEKETFSQEFKEFLSVLKGLVDKKGLDYLGAADDPNFDFQRINMSFGLDEESKVDELIRDIRDNLANNYTGAYFVKVKGKFPLAARKSHILSADCWSVEFYFAKSWQLQEDIQP
ncbi:MULTISPECIES: hypothetical protein [Vibrio]|uniref:Uncharacterized protein n=1 Tax=Vibrio tasmaniensis TaxID=212663 RepID=A0A2N7NN76_9VIBR|nr:hypothetical protein [Vibrio tasmaniensis]PMO83676.1 hypothetical protein BCT01_24510 [Vibrio tasmaniensis]PMP17686.1 hypothetical protein BCS92_24485 [Vibrio tasmaniensis]TKG27883.1 hypothetical protein FC057_22820 [Vibrio tasmaniensis]TKG35434.1 hypothetical protein FC063_24820 [Vibrio tasmaniensis]TKG41780.1 hypothetical protein FC061_23430 [Vibrio tasmaniensis]